MENSVKESYNKICKKWSVFRKTTPINKCIVDFANHLKPNARVLDVGCGSGYPISSYLSKQGFQVTGIDIAEEMIKEAKQLNLPNATFLVEDILNFKSEKKYDAIIAFDSIWHVRHDRQVQMYQMIASLMAPGGLFLFTHGKKDGEIVSKMWGESFYYSALDLEKVHETLKQNGFEILFSIEDYEEETTGDRELLVVAKKKEMVIETERLYLREMCQNDFEDLAEILQNPKVMYAYEHDFSDDDVQVWLDRQVERYCRYGFGLWAMILKSTDQMIGQAGLTIQSYKDKEVLEIGYHLKENFWHMGYAQEAAFGCKRYAFEHLNEDKVYAIIKSDNIASMKVAQRIGMHKEDEFVTRYYNGDMLHFLYSVHREIPYSV